MSNYRSPAPITPMTEEALASIGPPPSPHRFDTPQDKCPECGLSNQFAGWWKHDQYLPDAVYGIVCSPKRRFRSGFLWLRKCDLPKTHIHEFCKKCGAEWTTGCPKD